MSKPTTLAVCCIFGALKQAGLEQADAGTVRMAPKTPCAHSRSRPGALFPKKSETANLKLASSITLRQNQQNRSPDRNGENNYDTNKAGGTNVILLLVMVNANLVSREPDNTDTIA